MQTIAVAAQLVKRAAGLRAGRGRVCSRGSFQRGQQAGSRVAAGGNLPFTCRDWDGEIGNWMVKLADGTDALGRGNCQFFQSILILPILKAFPLFLGRRMSLFFSPLLSVAVVSTMWAMAHQAV